MARTEAQRSAASDSGTEPGRRELILRAAIDLFRTHGYEATGIDEIGAAAGITGPGVYRHFDSKQDILDEVLAYGGNRVLSHSTAIIEEQRPPRETLDLLVAALVDDVLSQPALVTVVLRERRHLSEKGRRLWDRRLREYQTEWIDVLDALRPELEREEAGAVVWVTLGMALAAAQYEGRTPRDRLGELLTGMLVGSLLGAPD